MRGKRILSICIYYNSYAAFIAKIIGGLRFAAYIYVADWLCGYLHHRADMGGTTLVGVCFYHSPERRLG